MGPNALPDRIPQIKKGTLNWPPDFIGFEICLLMVISQVESNLSVALYLKQSIN